MTEHDKSYLVASFTKEDLIDMFPEYGSCVEAMSDNELFRIADKASDAIQETYWVALQTLLYMQFHETGCVDTEEANDNGITL